MENEFLKALSFVWRELKSSGYSAAGVSEREMNIKPNVPILLWSGE